VSLSVVVLSLVLSVVSDPFATPENFFNVSRNFAFIGIIALGQTLAIITGGIDLSVGSVMGLSGIVTGLALQRGLPLEVGIAAGLATALLFGLINGALVAYVRVSPFVVTLGTLSIARSMALVVSDNQMVYEFGPDEKGFLALGGGSFLGLANPVWVLVVCALRLTAWGRHVFAIGGNEDAARLNGVAVERVKLSVYVWSSLSAGVAAILTVGWLGAVTNALGQTYELWVIGASVIGGANLAGGVGSAIGATVGAALIEVIRNGLLLAGVDPYWQGAFVGLFIILAVLTDKLEHLRKPV
jgi:ribose transport system permease protein